MFAVFTTSLAGTYTRTDSRAGVGTRFGTYRRMRRASTPASRRQQLHHHLDLYVLTNAFYQPHNNHNAWPVDSPRQEVACACRYVESDARCDQPDWMLMSFLGAPMAPFYIAGVVVLYGVNAFSGALADSMSFNQSSSFGLWEPLERRYMLTMESCSA